MCSSDLSNLRQMRKNKTTNCGFWQLEIPHNASHTFLIQCHNSTLPKTTSFCFVCRTFVASSNLSSISRTCDKCDKTKQQTVVFGNLRYHTMLVTRFLYNVTTARCQKPQDFILCFAHFSQVPICHPFLQPATHPTKQNTKLCFFST